MGQGVDQAQRQRELTKHALELDLNRLEARVRSELDWRTRLRREGPRLAAAGVVVVVVAGGILVLRRRLTRGRTHAAPPPTTLEDLTAELHEIRKALEKQKNGKSSSFVQKALLRGVSAAGTAGGTMLARQMLQRQMSSAEEGPGTTRAG